MGFCCRSSIFQFRVSLFIFLFIFHFEFGEWKSDCIVERVIFVCKLDCLDNADG